MNSAKAVLLMNLGSPDSPEVKDVRRYLNEFLMDEYVIDKYSYLMRLLLVKCIIVPFRVKNSAHAYSTVWTNEGSPLIAITKQVKDALQKIIDCPVDIAMRYGNPHPKTAFDNFSKNHSGINEVILFPMYPHYAMSSYETAVEYAKKIHKENGYTFKLKVLAPYYNHPAYIQAMCNNMLPYLNQKYDHILFSFHGIPERHLSVSSPNKHHKIEDGVCCENDPAAQATCYRYQCITTMELMMDSLQIPKSMYSFSFQSRLGKEPWLKPYTDYVLADLPKEGVKNLLILCPAFVSDCLETLEEIEMRGREIFMEAGGESYTMIPCMNNHPDWIQSIKQLVN
jgi:ferrochelatase